MNRKEWWWLCRDFKPNGFNFVACFLGYFPISLVDFERHPHAPINFTGLIGPPFPWKSEFKYNNPHPKTSHSTGDLHPYADSGHNQIYIIYCNNSWFVRLWDADFNVWWIEGFLTSLALRNTRDLHRSAAPELISPNYVREKYSREVVQWVWPYLVRISFSTELSL